MKAEAPRVLIIHGTKGYPEENWFPWLRNECIELGWVVDIPRLPSPESQSLTAWKDAFQKQCGNRQYDVAVGHSLGTCFLLRLAQYDRLLLSLLISVAGCIGETGIDEFDNLNASFTEPEFDWKAVRARIKHSIVVHSDNDPYVPLDQTSRLIRELQAETIALAGAGHINSAAGFTTLPVVLERIMSYINSGTEPLPM